MSLRTNQQGVAHLVVILLVIVVAVVAFAGYKVATKSSEPQAATTAQTEDTGYTSSSDLDTASSELDTDTGVDPDQLDADVDALL